MPVVPRKSTPDLLWRPARRTGAAGGRRLTTACGKVSACRTSRCCRGAWAAPASSRACSTASPAGRLPGVAADATVTVVANTADDIWVHGLKVCPDLDTVMYTLGDGIDLERGWGRRDETWSAKDELAAYGVEPTWFGLGDRDIATHLVRTQMLDAGYPLSAGDRGAVPALAHPDFGDGVRLLPMTDDRVETHVAIADPDSPSGRRVVHFQEYWVRLRAAVPGRDRASSSGSRTPRPAPGVIDAITDADLVVLPPSNPVVSVGTILGVPRVREALAATPAPVVGPLPHRRRHPRARHGRADADLDRRRGQRRRRRAPLRRPRRTAACSTAGSSTRSTPTRSTRLEAAGLPCRAVPLMMTDPDATAAMAAAAVELVARDDRPRGHRARRRARGASPATTWSRSLLPLTSTSPTATCVVVTSKVVSKAEGRLRRGDREDALPGETVRVVARRGETTIVRNHLGLTMAAAGIDNSNVAAGPDRAAARGPGRARPARCATASASAPASTSPSIVTDTAGRAWREGQTDIAIGAAGLVVAEDYAGRTDAHGNELAVTLPAVADELAGAAELATGKLGGRPFAVVRGRADLVLPAGEHGPGAARWSAPRAPTCSGTAPARPSCARCAADPADQRPFGAPAPRRRAGRRDPRRGRPASPSHTRSRRRSADGDLPARAGARRSTALDLRPRLGRSTRPTTPTKSGCGPRSV